MKNATEILLSANLNAEELLKDITGTCERIIKLGMEEGIKASAGVDLNLVPENEWCGQYAEYFKIDRSNILNLINKIQ